MPQKSLTRSEIYEMAKRRLGLPYAESHRLLDDIFSLMRGSLERGADVKIARFGVFVVHHKKARIGRNPKTREEVVINERYSVSFRPSGVLRERVRRSAGGAESGAERGAGPDDGAA